MSDYADRERVTNVLAMLALAAVLAITAWWAWPDVKAGWVASALARASFGGAP